MEHRTTIARSGARHKGGRAAPGSRGDSGGWHWGRWLGLAGALALLVGLGLGWPWLHAQSRVAASYGARVACACRYVAGRPLGDCAKDFEPGMGLVWLSENAASRTITARYAILASQTASWRPGFGCMLEPWKD